MELLPNEQVIGSSIIVRGLSKEEMEEWKKTRLPLLQKEVRKNISSKPVYIPPTRGEVTNLGDMSI